MNESDLNLGMMISDGISSPPKPVEPVVFAESSIARLGSPERIQETADWVEEVLAQYNFPEAVENVVSLQLFNAMAKNPSLDSEEIDKIIVEAEELEALEEALSGRDNPLPTIGIELEVPKTEATESLVSVLEQLDIKNTIEGESGQLWEVNGVYSYGAKLQARMLQELAKSGFVPLEKGNQPVSENNQNDLARYQIPRSAPLSLHINLGLSFMADKRMLGKYSTEATEMSDILVLAYSSPERLETRKSIESITSDKSAEATIKNKPLLGRRPRHRIELKAVEFKDASSYQLLFRSQLLGAALDSYAEFHEGGLTGQHSNRRQLAEIYSRFLMEADRLMIKYHLPEWGMLESSGSQAVIISKLKETDLQQDARSLVRQFAGEVSRLLNADTPTPESDG